MYIHITYMHVATTQVCGAWYYKSMDNGVAHDTISYPHPVCSRKKSTFGTLKCQ